MLLRRLALVLAFGAAVLAGCGNNGQGTVLGTTTSQSALRFLNGSPDLGPVDVYINGTSSAAFVTKLGYPSLSAITNVNTQSYTVTVTPNGTPATTRLTCPLNNLAASTRYTVVIAGKAAQGTSSLGLQCLVFPETYYSIPATQFQLAFHHASPALNAVVTAGSTASPPPSAVAFGTYPAGTTNWQLFGGQSSFVAATQGVGTGTPTNVLLNGSQTAPGIGVYVASTASNPPAAGAAGVYASTPVSACVSGGATIPSTNPDTASFFPYSYTASGATSATLVSNVLMVYAIDGASATSQLVCAFDD